MVGVQQYTYAYYFASTRRSFSTPWGKGIPRGGQPYLCHPTLWESVSKDDRSRPKPEVRWGALWKVSGGLTNAMGKQTRPVNLVFLDGLLNGITDFIQSIGGN